jgi:serine/threonine protein kinase
MSEMPSSSEREQRLERILADYLHAVEAGTAPDRAALLQQHPDLAEDLDSFFRNRDEVQRIAEPIKQQVRALPETGDESGASSAGVGTTIRYFGDYELLEEIARGGMGVVYKARQISLNRIVALKMILEGELASPADVRRFYYEAEAAANLDHPNVVPIYEVGEHEGQHYFTMKFIPGGSLAQHLALCTQNQRFAAQLLMIVARAVHQAHQRGILHRDLKPANILLEPFPAQASRRASDPAVYRPMVTDFGLARRVVADHRGAQSAAGSTPGPTASERSAIAHRPSASADPALPAAMSAGTDPRLTQPRTQPGAILGTPNYMPPEQAAGQSRGSIAADVYGLGAILYEMLTGQPPFRAGTTLDTLLQVIEKQPERPRSLSPRVKPELEAVCLKCLAKNPKKRYGSAQALANDLARWLTGQRVQAYHYSAMELVRRLGLQGLGILLVGSCTVSLIVIIYWFLSFAGSDKKLIALLITLLIALMTLMTLIFTSILLAAYWRKTNALPGQPNGESTMPPGVAPRGKRPSAGSGTETPQKVSATFSPDCRRFVAVGRYNMLKIWDATTGAELLTLDGHRGQVYGLTFDPNGQRLASAGEDGVVQVWDAITGRKLLTLAGQLDLVYGVAFSPDAQRLATASRDQTVRLWDAETGQLIRTLRGHTAEVWSVTYSCDGQRLASVSSNEMKVWDATTGQEILNLDRRD